ncbi:hypothetical protein FS749_014641 [Ceratobasidium sp. UAMH 11750]|nr:hypothetical protein FS749_014641 [Ceratobasidium sp. UAMH 11750]
MIKRTEGKGAERKSTLTSSFHTTTTTTTTERAMVTDVHPIVDEQRGYIPYQRRTRLARREADHAAMPPTRPDRTRPTQPPRPPNAWILYRSDKLRELAAVQPPGPRKPQAEISKIISQMWSAEGPETKGHYEARAEEKKAEHAALYPDYKFAPMKKEDKALMRKAQRQEKEELKQLERTRARKRKGKGRADDDDDEDEAPSRSFVTAPAQLPYPLSANTTPTQRVQQPRPVQTWYPPSTYGPQHDYQHVNGHPSPPQPQPHRIPPPPLPPHLQPARPGARTASGSSAFAAAGWSVPVDPSQPDQPFSVNAYRQARDQDDADEEEPPAWGGEEAEVGAEEAWHGRTRRGAVWDEQVQDPSYQPQYYDSYQNEGYQPNYQQQNWARESTPPQPAHSQQSQSLTITLPATLNPSDSDPYTFNLDFDMPMAPYAADPDAHVAISLAGVNLEEQPSSSAPVGSGLLTGVEYGVPGLNAMLSAPLPDIDVAFPEFMVASGDQGQAQGFDMLSADNEEWWQALMDAAFVGNAPPEQQSFAVAGPSQPRQEVDPSSPERAFKGANGDVMLSMSREDTVGQLGLDSSVPSGSRPARPAPVHAHSMPASTFAHGLPSPGPRETFDEQQGRPRASSSAYPAQSGAGSYAEPSYQQSYPEQSYVPQQQEEVDPSPFAQIARAPAPNRRVGGSWAPAPLPSRAKTQSMGRPQFPSPSGATQVPSPSGGVPQQQPRGFPHSNTAAPPTYYPPPPLFTARKAEKEKEKDSEAFDFSGWGNHCDELMICDDHLDFL